MSPSLNTPATRPHAFTVTRWIARACSILSILAALAFSGGELASVSGPQPVSQEWIGLALWPVGVAVGLLLAWHHEGAGGIFALVCLAVFYGWNLLSFGRLPRGPFFILIAAPAFIFLIAEFLSHRSAVRQT